MYKHILITGLLAATMFMCACSTTNPRYAQMTDELGRSYETARFNQIINPDAGLSAMAMDGIDGQAGEAAYKNYQDGFKVKTQPPPVFNLNLGPGGS